MRAHATCPGVLLQSSAKASAPTCTSPASSTTCSRSRTQLEIRVHVARCFVVAVDVDPLDLVARVPELALLLLDARVAHGTSAVVVDLRLRHGAHAPLSESPQQRRKHSAAPPVRRAPSFALHCGAFRETICDAVHEKSRNRAGFRRWHGYCLVMIEFDASRTLSLGNALTKEDLVRSNLVLAIAASVASLSRSARTVAACTKRSRCMDASETFR